MSPYGSYILRPQILLRKEENRQTWLGGDGSGRVGEGAAETKQICGGGSLGAGRCVAGPPEPARRRQDAAQVVGRVEAGPPGACRWAKRRPLGDEPRPSPCAGQPVTRKHEVSGEGHGRALRRAVSEQGGRGGRAQKPEAQFGEKREWSAAAGREPPRGGGNPPGRSPAGSGNGRLRPRG